MGPSVDASTKRSVISAGSWQVRSGHAVRWSMTVPPLKAVDAVAPTNPGKPVRARRSVNKDAQPRDVTSLLRKGRGDVGPRAHAELAQDVGDVHGGRTRRDVEAGGEFGVGEPIGDQLSDLALARREPGG